MSVCYKPPPPPPSEKCRAFNVTNCAWCRAGAGGAASVGSAAPVAGALVVQCIKLPLPSMGGGWGEGGNSLAKFPRRFHPLPSPPPSRGGRIIVISPASQSAQRKSTIFSLLAFSPPPGNDVPMWNVASVSPWTSAGSYFCSASTAVPGRICLRIKRLAAPTPPAPSGTKRHNFRKIQWPVKRPQCRLSQPHQNQGVKLPLKGYFLRI